MLFLLICLLAAPAAAALTTTEVTITKLASDDETVLCRATVDWVWMMENLPVLGDGQTVYYTQGPVFEGAWEDTHPGETYDPWNPDEDVNILYKDHGEFMGTDVAALLDLVGGADPADLVAFRAADGLTKRWPAAYIDTPDPGQGPFGLIWYHGDDLGYVNESFDHGMRLYFFGETTNAAGMHVWGNWDMHESWNETFWYYYNGHYPSASGTSVMYVRNITIHSAISPYAPVAGFSADPLSGDAPLSVQFTDTSMNAPTAWWWKFGDGATSDEQHPVHVYRAEGNYTVTLAVSNAWGNDSLTQEDCIRVDRPPMTVNFSAAPLEGFVPLSVQFTGLTEGSPSSWNWSFGDGATSGEPNPVHPYTVPGTYDVSLSVDGGAGSCVKPEYIRVLPCLPGDANGDGAVNQADTLRVLKEVVGLVAKPEAGTERFHATDVHRNGVIETGDALYIAQCNVGLRDRWFEVVEG
ncbi:PKD domain-containing protein [Methanofollis fontis]|nr:PKD domain-containing protein [Methanofollis fontis]